MNGPVASLFRVKLEARRAEAEEPPVTAERFTRAFHVAARDAEAAVISARACYDRMCEAEQTRVVSVEIIGSIDALLANNATPSGSPRPGEG